MYSLQKHKIRKLVLSGLAATLVLFAGETIGVNAASCTGNGVFDPTQQCSASNNNNGETQTCPDKSVISIDATCPGASPSNPAPTACSSSTNSSDCSIQAQPLTDCSAPNAVDAAMKCSKIMTDFVDPLLKFLAAGVGVIVVIMVIVGGVQYVTANGNPQAAQNARKKIINALIAFTTFIFLYALLEWLIPGGVPLP